MRNLRTYMGGLGNNLFQFAYLYAQVKEGKLPDIYLQDPAYFSKYAGELQSLLGEGIGFLPYVSIHVRRGDYLIRHAGFYTNLCENKYYERAIALFPDDKFLVFCKDGQDAQQDSNDREWCEKYFTTLVGKERFQFVSGDDYIEDLNMMASCKSNIIANSSYSWWAAYLNPNPAKVVVAPTAWHPDGIERTKCPSNWIRL